MNIYMSYSRGYFVCINCVISLHAEQRVDYPVQLLSLI
jgi:hypothetical protein